jgi:hypothetical protein
MAAQHWTFDNMTFGLGQAAVAGDQAKTEALGVAAAAAAGDAEYAAAATTIETEPRERRLS